MLLTRSIEAFVDFSSANAPWPLAWIVSDTFATTRNAKPMGTSTTHQPSNSGLSSPHGPSPSWEWISWAHFQWPKDRSNSYWWQYTTSPNRLRSSHWLLSTPRRFNGSYGKILYIGAAEKARQSKGIVGRAVAKYHLGVPLHPTNHYGTDAMISNKVDEPSLRQLECHLGRPRPSRGNSRASLHMTRGGKAMLEKKGEESKLTTNWEGPLRVQEELDNDTSTGEPRRDVHSEDVECHIP
ncbi:hypothetical protein CR513_54038, partial [Mucuna pruriens]